MLSLKYSIEKDKLEQIITEYENLHPSLLKMIMQTYSKTGDENIGSASINNSLTYEKSITTLSRKYQVKNETLASILIDYRLLEKEGYNGREGDYYGPDSDY